MHRVRLSTKASPPVLVTAAGRYERFRRTKVAITAVADLAGDTVTVRAGRRRLGRGTLALDGRRASLELEVLMPPRGAPFGPLDVRVGRKKVAVVKLPDADEQRARGLIEAELHFRPYVFSGMEFPECDFERPLLAEELIGRYEVRTTFYDKDYNEVTAAENTGRYGAVVEIVPEKGRVIRRYRTLYRQPEEFVGFNWWRYKAKVSMSLPDAMGIEADVLGEQSRVVGTHLKWRFHDGFYRDSGSAALLAGLHETRPGAGAASVADDVYAQDRQWWVGLKRKLYGTEKLYPDAFVCPRPLEGEPAPVLREGSAADAGMKGDAVDRIDAVCRAWAEDSDEAFAVCIARHGVVFFHKAYGERDGRPMTVTTKSWMASLTKLMSGTLMMMLVDQSLVSLDDRVDTYLLPLRDIEVETPLTIRHLYTHTNGLWEHWGDDMHDLEEVVAGYYPHLEVGQRYEYNGVGFALGGKVVEAVTGEAIPQFYKNHLLGPLGCASTDVVGTSGDADSVPMDVARIGQMLLNRGAYGTMRFFSEETFKQILPEKLVTLLGADTQVVYGIGTIWYEDEGLGEGTFGHGAASGATLRIDPANGLVIAMTRNAAGENLGKYHKQFIAAIVEGLSD